MCVYLSKENKENITHTEHQILTSHVNLQFIKVERLWLLGLPKLRSRAPEMIRAFEKQSRAPERIRSSEMEH